MTATAASPAPFSHLPPPHPALQACVVIPARDEARGINAALEALARGRDLDGSPLDPARFEILLLCNNCRDETAEIAREFAARHPEIALHVAETDLRGDRANVGNARRLLMNAACQRLESAFRLAQQRVSAEAKPREAKQRETKQRQARQHEAHSRECPKCDSHLHPPRAICSTDADTRVFPTWIAATLAEIAAGAEAVGGRILMAEAETGASGRQNRFESAVPNQNSSADRAPLGAKTRRAAYLRDTGYRLYAARLEALIDPQSADPAPRHFQFFGASLAITPRAYHAVGGLPRVACLEDVELKRALIRADIALRHSPHVRVTTSARAAGRVEVGLSSQLREWDDLGAQNRAWLVPSPAALHFKWSARRALRSLYSRGFEGIDGTAQVEELGRELRLDPCWLLRRARETDSFGALWLRVERALDDDSELRAQMPPVPVETALAQLRAMLQGVGEK